MQLSKIELISASLGILVLFVTGSGYIMVLNDKVSDLKAEKLERSEEFNKLKKEINITLQKEIDSVKKERETLASLKKNLEEKILVKDKFLIGKILDSGFRDMEERDYKSAIIKFKEILEKDHNNKIAITGIIKAYYLDVSPSNRNDNIIMAHIDRLADLGHNEYYSFYVKGAILSRSSDEVGAISAYKRSIEIRGDRLDSHRALFYIYKKNNNHEQSLHHINRYIELSGNHPMGYSMRAELYEKMGDLKKAKSDYERTVKLGDAAGYKVGYLDNAKKKIKSLP